MKNDSQPSMLRSDLTVAAFCVFFVIAALIFRDNLGLVGTIAIAVAAFVQLIRVIFLRGKLATLKSFFKELLNSLSGL